MATFDDDDELEYIAIGKCSKALLPLDGESRIRVLRYLLDKFGLIEPNTFINHVNMDLHSQSTQLKIEDKTDISATVSRDISGDKPSIRDIIIKNYAKTESDLALVIAYYASNFASDTFKRQLFLDTYKENNIQTAQRCKNLTGIIKGLIRKSYLKTITENTYTVLPAGVEQAEIIIAGNSTSKYKTRNSSNKK